MQEKEMPKAELRSMLGPFSFYIPEWPEGVQNISHPGLFIVSMRTTCAYKDISKLSVYHGQNGHIMIEYRTWKRPRYLDHLFYLTRC